MEISCKKTNCVFNKSNHCAAKEILVGSDLDCKTFKIDSSKPSPATNMLKTSLYEIGEIEKNFVEKDNIDVSCKARRCVFNKDGVCSANGICILSGKKKSAFCATNIKK